jgi:hypothetical protein
MEKPQSPWQRIPAVIVAILHAIAGVVGSGVFFATDHPGTGAAFGGANLVAALTSAILGSHMFAPSTVKRVSQTVGWIDTVAPKVMGVLDQLKQVLDSVPQPMQSVQLESVAAPLVAPAHPVVLTINTNGQPNSNVSWDAQPPPGGPGASSASFDTKMGQEVDESPEG